MHPFDLDPLRLQSAVSGVSPQVARADAQRVIQMMGARAAVRVPTATLLHIGDWLNWPEWLRDGTSLAGTSGPLPALISRADDVIIMANIVESADVFALVELMLTKPRPALSLAGELAVLHGPNLGESIMMVVRGLAARHLWIRLEVCERAEEVEITVQPVCAPGRLYSALALCVLTLLHRSVTAYRADRLEGMRVATRFQAVPEARGAFAAFGCEIECAAKVDGLRFPIAWLGQSNPHYDPLVWDVAKAKIAGLEHEIASIDAVDPLRDFIVDHLSRLRRVPRLKQAAAHLGISPRTIVRSLSRQKTSYHRLVDEERKARALALIADTSLSLAEVADELGFSDMSSFGRSFRGWFGDSPGHLRKLSSECADIAPDSASH